jgi:hypothetical protein
LTKRQIGLFCRHGSIKKPEAVWLEFAFAGGLVMKVFRSRLKSGRLIVLSVAILVCGAKISAQTAGSGTVPVVTIQATDPIATPVSPGAFTVFRHGDTNLALNVYYQIGGTASNGADYALISNWVTISAGATSNSIAISPIKNEASSAAETVILQLAPSPLMSPLIPINYEIGVPSNAVVYVENNGATNLPPVTRMISPPNGETFWSPVNLPIYAYANDPNGSVASVEFFSGANSLGFGHPVTIVPPPLPPGPIQPPILIVAPTNYWELTWSNAPAGSYTLTVKASDNDGASTTSAPVKITILPSPPPPTNRPPVVSIVANDPVAIEGTNCWVWLGETNVPPTWAAWPAAVCRLFTNCGPKTATFTVFRFGDTNGNLTLPYDIGGTASNGVDYVTLPGTVTIPAGERRALITIVPIDDGPPDVNKTVILALTPATTTPPDYFLGFPRRAAAIIIDSDGPRPVASLLPDGCFHLVTPGPDAAWFCVQYSTDLANWTTVCTNQVINGSINFVDPDAAGNPSRFYRAVPLTNPPSD